MINDSGSSWRPVTNSDAQRLVMGLDLFSIFIDDLENIKRIYFGVEVLTEGSFTEARLQESLGKLCKRSSGRAREPPVPMSGKSRA